MSKTKSTTTFGPNLLDVRVRDRFLTNGALDPKSLDKQLSELPDMADECEPVGLRQPALSATVDEVEEDEEGES